MKKKVKILCLAVLGLFLFTSVATAENVRPFVPPTGDLSALQSVFTGIGSTINVNTNQLSAAYFNPTGFGQSAAAFIAQVTWSQSQSLNSGIEFGLYQYGNPSNNVTVISPFSAPLATVTIEFDFVAGTVTTRAGSTVIDTASFTGPFGFYTYTPYAGTGYLYSDDSLNPYGSAQQLIYAAKGDNVSLPYGAPVLTLNDVAHYYIGAEGLSYNKTGASFSEGSIDFNDMVIMLESVRPVPEPMTLILLGSGLLGLAAIRRKK